MAGSEKKLLIWQVVQWAGGQRKEICNLVTPPPLQWWHVGKGKELHGSLSYMARKGKESVPGTKVAGKWLDGG